MAFDDELESLIGELGQARKRNNTPGAEKARRSGQRSHTKANLAKATRVAHRSPEVMVKVSGGAKGMKHTREHLNYITRNGKIEAENQEGEKINGVDAVKAVAKEWSTGYSMNKRNTSKNTVNLVLSMPPGTDEKKLKQAVRAFAARNFGADREYLFVQHKDTKHPHCHLTLQAVGYDRKRLNPRKNDLQLWRESFAQCLREQGVTAEATPRKTRGVVRKGKKQAVHHAQKAGRSTVAKSRLKEAAARVDGKDTKERPWERAIQEQQKKVRGLWEKTATTLAANDKPEAKQLAKLMARFVQDMPPVATEQQLTEAALKKRLSQARQAQRGKNHGKER